MKYIIIKFVILLMVISLALGCVYNPSVGPNINVTNDYTTYENTSFHIIIEYPHNWIKYENVSSTWPATIVYFCSPDNQSYNKLPEMYDGCFAVKLGEPYTANKPGIISSIYMAEFLHRYREKYYNRNISENYTTIGGYPACIINYSESIDNATINGILALVTIGEEEYYNEYNNATMYRIIAYQLEYSALKPIYDKYQKNILYMVDSFKYTKG